MAKELLKRSEVKEEYTWNLKDMYASDEDWKKDLDEIDKILDEIGKMEGKVAACAQNLLFVLERAAKAEEKLDYDFMQSVCLMKTRKIRHIRQCPRKCILC